MKVIVTGCNGFIARHLIKRLLRDGYEVVGIDDYSNSQPDKEWESKFEFHQQDISKLSPEHSLYHSVEGIFHLAAKARVQPSFIDPIKYHNTNVMGTLNLLEACRLWKIYKFVFSSSSSVYGNLVVPETGFCSLLDKPNPQSPYAFTKVQGEELCRFYELMYNINCIKLRYYNVYGDNQPSSGQYPQMLPYFISLYKQNKPFTIYGDGEQRRDFTHVDDVVSANVNALHTKYKFISTFDIGTGINYSVNEICNLIDRDHPKQFLPARNEPKITLCDNREAKRLLNWNPTTTVEQWIKSRDLKV